jgi:hypothetical protein
MICPCLQASDLDALRAEHRLQQQLSLEATELRLQISQMKDITQDLTALQQEYQQLCKQKVANEQQTQQMQAQVRHGFFSFQVYELSRPRWLKAAVPCTCSSCCPGGDSLHHVLLCRLTRSRSL